jgi:hypothetical protein
LLLSSGRSAVDPEIDPARVAGPMLDGRGTERQLELFNV